MLAHRYRLPIALVAAAIAAGSATILLRPRKGVVKPAPARAGDYFTPAELERAHRYRAPQRAILLISTAFDATLLGLLAARPPALFERLERRPVAGAAAAAAALTGGLTMAGLPLSIVSERRARAFGISTQRWGPWFGDMAKSTAIGSAMAAVGGGLAPDSSAA